MGIVIGKIWRKKTTVEALETIDKQIKLIEEYRKNTEQSQKRIVGRFVLISCGIYLIAALLFYFYFFPSTFYDRLFYIIPLIGAPVIILSVKRVLLWYYTRKISRKQTKLSSLREEKKMMLDKVMETETYKVAKNILEKYSEAPVIRKNTPYYSTPQITSSPVTSVSSYTGLRQRVPSTSHLAITAAPATPLSRPTTTLMSSSAIRMAEYARMPMVPGTPISMPRAVLPRDRSIFDKMVDYLVGDGPANRYALICKNCSSHNGMAFREEYEYISFRCCYCYTLNPACKQRPAAPKLEFEEKLPLVRNLSDTSDSDKNSPSDSENEVETRKMKGDGAQSPSDDLEETLKVSEPEESENNPKDELNDRQEVEEVKFIDKDEDVANDDENVTH